MQQTCKKKKGKIKKQERSNVHMIIMDENYNVIQSIICICTLLLSQLIKASIQSNHFKSSEYLFIIYIQNGFFGHHLFVIRTFPSIFFTTFRVT